MAKWAEQPKDPEIERLEKRIRVLEALVIRHEKIFTNMENWANRR